MDQYCNEDCINCKFFEECLSAKIPEIYIAEENGRQGGKLPEIPPDIKNLIEKMDFKIPEDGDLFIFQSKKRQSKICFVLKTLKGERTSYQTTGKIKKSICLHFRGGKLVKTKDN